MKAVLIPVVAATLFVVPVSAQQTAVSAEVAEGRRVFHQKCALCHVAGTIGEQPYGPRLSRAQVDKSEDGVRQIIRAGTARMPGFQYTLDAPKIAAVIAFLKTLDAPPDRVVVSTPAP